MADLTLTQWIVGAVVLIGAIVVHMMNRREKAVFFAALDRERWAAYQTRWALQMVAKHPTTTELPNGRVQITLEPQEWERIREAAR